MLFLPRLHGRGFSPLSVWSFPKALLFEVHNTGGEAHSYLALRGALNRQHARKRLWVSPFSDMHGRYTFGYAADDQALDLRVRLYDSQGLALLARLSVTCQPLNPAGLHQVAQVPGTSGTRTFATILWQALKLRCLGLRFHWGPFAPCQPASRAVFLTSPAKSGRDGEGGCPCS